MTINPLTLTPSNSACEEWQVRVDSKLYNSSGQFPFHLNASLGYLALVTVLT